MDELFETGVHAMLAPTPNFHLRIHDLKYFLFRNQVVDLDAIFETGVNAMLTPAPKISICISFLIYRL